MSEIYGEAKRPHVCVNYGRHHCVHSGFVPNLFVYWFLHLILGLHRGFFLCMYHKVFERFMASDNMFPQTLRIVSVYKHVIPSVSLISHFEQKDRCARNYAA